MTKKMPRVFVDLDGPTVDFDRYMLERGLTADEVKRRPGSYAEMYPTKGAIESIRAIAAMGFEVFFASKPPTAVPWAYADKVSWVMLHVEELKKKIIFTPDKGLLGDRDDFLIDDHPDWANCQHFPGTLLHYIHGGDGPGPAHSWPQIVRFLGEIAKAYKEPSCQ